MSTALTIGKSTVLTQNVNYALPSKMVMVTSSAAVDVSVDQSNWSALAGYAAGAVTGAGFIRSAGVGTSVLCKDASQSAGAGGGASSGNLKVTDYIAIGNNPAKTGAIRLTNNNTSIKGRGGNNDIDIEMMKLQPDNFIIVGDGNSAVAVELSYFFPGGISQNQVVQTGRIEVGTNPAQSGAIRLASGGDIQCRNSGNTADIRCIGWDGANFYFGGNAPVIYQGTSHTFTNAVLAGLAQLGLNERAAPAAPAADKANIWIQDNGSGKTQLMIQFSTGAPIQIAIQV
jgi:hypothetical protein